MTHLTKLFQTVDAIDADPTLTPEQKCLMAGLQFRNLAYCLGTGILPDAPASEQDRAKIVSRVQGIVVEARKQ